MQRGADKISRALFMNTRIVTVLLAGYQVWRTYWLNIMWMKYLIHSHRLSITSKGDTAASDVSHILWTHQVEPLAYYISDYERSGDPTHHPLESLTTSHSKILTQLLKRNYLKQCTLVFKIYKVSYSNTLITVSLSTRPKWRKNDLQRKCSLSFLSYTCAKPLGSIPLCYFCCLSATDHKTQFVRLLPESLGILTEESCESEKRD